MDLLDIICFNLCPLESIFGGYKFSITTREEKKKGNKARQDLKQQDFHPAGTFLTDV